MNDWRIPKESEKIYDEAYKGIKLLQIVFPQFWQRAYETKNNFFQEVFEDAKHHVETYDNTYEEYLKDERVARFWHMHCIFCMKTITTDMQEECYRSIDDDLVWVCAECFNDFKERFEWTAQEKVQDIPAEGFSALEVNVANTKDKT